MYTDEVGHNTCHPKIRFPTDFTDMLKALNTSQINTEEIEDYIKNYTNPPSARSIGRNKQPRRNVPNVSTNARNNEGNRTTNGRNNGLPINNASTNMGNTTFRCLKPPDRPSCASATPESIKECETKYKEGSREPFQCCFNETTYICKDNPNRVEWSGGKNTKPKWINTKRTTTVKSVKKTVYRNSVTGELRVRKMVPRSDGRIRATYVKYRS